MKAAIIDEPGASIRVGDFPDPVPTTEESVMDVEAAGIHPVVRSLAAGRQYGSANLYPVVPGIDCVASGDDGASRYVGSIRPPWGTIAQQVAARRGPTVPDGVDSSVIAATLNPGMSSWVQLSRRLRQVDELGCVIVVGATGVAGGIAVQSALALGASRVVGIGRDQDGLARVGRLGAVPVSLDRGTEGLRDALNGASPSLVLDYVWNDAAEVVWDALRIQGMSDDQDDIDYVQLGTTGGNRAALLGDLLRSRRITVRGGGAGSTPVAEIVAELPTFIEHIAKGETAAAVRRFPLSRIDEAWEHRGPGRAVIVPD